MSSAAPAKLGVDVQWTKCPNCDAFVYYKRLKRNLGVCPECNHHFRIPVRVRLNQLLDQDSFEELSGDLEPTSLDAALERAIDNLEAAIEETGAVIHRDPLPDVVGDANLLAALSRTWSATP